MFKFNVPLLKDVKSDDGGLRIEGTISSTSLDAHNEVITKKALIRVAQSLRGVKIIKDHNATCDSTVGVVEDAWTVGNKLNIRGRFSKTEEQLVEKIREGIITSFSVGGTVNDYEDDGDVRMLTDISIHEVSLTPTPANKDADIYSILAKSIKIDNHSEEEKPHELKGDTMEKGKKKKKPEEDVLEAEEVVEPVDVDVSETEPESEEPEEEPKEEKETEQEKVDKTVNVTSEVKKLQTTIEALTASFEKWKTEKSASGRISEVNMGEDADGVVKFMRNFLKKK